MNDAVSAENHVFDIVGKRRHDASCSGKNSPDIIEHTELTVEEEEGDEYGCFRCQDDPCADHSCSQHLSQRRLLRQSHYLHPDPGRESRPPSSAGKEQHSICRFRYHAFRPEPALGSESQAVI